MSPFTAASAGCRIRGHKLTPNRPLQAEDGSARAVRGTRRLLDCSAGAPVLNGISLLSLSFFPLIVSPTSSPWDLNTPTVSQHFFSGRHEEEILVRCVTQRTMPTGRPYPCLARGGHRRHPALNQALPRARSRTAEITLENRRSVSASDFCW